MIVRHKNEFSTYLSDWIMSLQMIQISSPSQTNRKRIIRPKPFHALSENTYELSFMLYHLHANMLLLEKSAIYEFDAMAYSKTRVYLKSVYIFYRILLDTLVAVIEYFYKTNEKIILPSNFHDLLNKQRGGKLPEELSSVIQNTLSWFPDLKSRRDDLVHHYHAFLILFQKDQKGETILDHVYLNSFNYKTPNGESLGGIRDYIGFLLKCYQELVDSLITLFDLKFQEWYAVRRDNSRTETILEGIPGYMLWWASIYGRYQSDDIQIIDEG